MESYKEFSGKDIDEAIAEACGHFGVDRDKLEIEIQDNGKSGIFGLVGAKKATVQARLRDSDPEPGRIIAQVVRQLVEPITAVSSVDVAMEEGRARVTIGSEAEPNLLIGKEGATLSALEYLANRIVARRLREPVRIRLDAGNYRERQDDDLRQLALHLADKALSQARAQSTRPLSSYHRRVVHLALQEHESVTTRSKGEGPLKRVLILPRKGGR